MGTGAPANDMVVLSWVESGLGTAAPHSMHSTSLLIMNSAQPGPLGIECLAVQEDEPPRSPLPCCHLPPHQPQPQGAVPHRWQRVLCVLTHAAPPAAPAVPGKSYPLEAVKDAVLESQRPGRGGKVLLED